MIGRAKDAVTEFDSFQLFMDPTIIADITERTYKNITKYMESLDEGQLKSTRTKGVCARVHISGITGVLKRFGRAIQYSLQPWRATGTL